MPRIKSLRMMMLKKIKNNFGENAKDCILDSLIFGIIIILINLTC